MSSLFAQEGNISAGKLLQLFHVVAKSSLTTSGVRKREANLSWAHVYKYHGVARRFWYNTLVAGKKRGADQPVFHDNDLLIAAISFVKVR